MGSRWQPEPEVTWLDSKGTVLQAITLFTENPTGMYSFVSSLKQVNVPTTYTFKVQNLLVTATSSTNVTGNQHTLVSIQTFIWCICSNPIGYSMIWTYNWLTFNL